MNDFFLNYQNFQLMKGTCVQCHRLTCNSSGLSAKLLLAQLRAMDLGLISVAQELGGFFKNHFSAKNGSGTLNGSYTS